MYVPKIHQSPSQKEVVDYVRKYSFATLVSTVEGRSIATHIPMIIEESEGEKLTLYGHLSVANEQKICFDGKREILAIFMESHAYVSSSWYDHINVPTWNYVAVHLYGKAVVIKGNKLEEAIVKLVENYEGGRKKRFNLSDMPDKMKKAHFKGVVGFKMSVDRIEAAHKLSQNRNENDYNNVITQLEKEGDPGSKAIAEEMKKLKF